MDHTPFDYIALSLLSFLGLVALTFLAWELRDWLRQRASVPEPPAQPPAREPVPSTQLSEVPPTELWQQEQVPRTRSRGREDNERGSALRNRLQKLLDQGVGLELNTPASLVATAAIIRPITREEDVEAWEADVESALRDRPRDIALFHYERPRSPLESLGAAAALQNPFKRRLQQRTHQLETIIGRLQ